MRPISDYLNEYTIMAKTNKTTKTSTARKAAPKNTAAKPTAIKSKGKVTKRKAAPLATNTAASLDINWKQALIGGGIGAAVGGIVTKVLFLR